MRLRVIFPLLAASSLFAANEVTFDGVTLQGLTTLTDTSALATFGSYSAPAIASVTDANWSTDGINSMGPSGNLVGEFGGNYTASGNSIYVISPASGAAPGGHTAHMGSFAVSLLLANDQFVSVGTFSDLDFTVTNYGVSGNFYGSNGAFNPGQIKAQYLKIDLGQFDTQAVGVKGIKFTNFTGPALDLSYVGIGGTANGGGAIPEPSVYGLALGGLALVGAIVRRRSRK